MFASDRDMQVLALVVAAACAIPGVFLVLRRMALITDAISHVILLGIVLAFFLVRDLKSPLLVLGAAAGGVMTVALVELIYHTRLVRQDAAIGLVYPALFSVAIILVSRYLRNVHLDVDVVLVGDLAQAASEHVCIFQRFVLPRATLVMLILLAINIAFVALFWKELKLSTFDPVLAEWQGFRPGWLQDALMVVVSLTAVAAFDAVGPVLVVPLMIVPAATSYLLSDRLGVIVVWSVALAMIGAESGFYLARWFDANFAGAMATVLGAEFALAWVGAPRRGWWARWRQRRQSQRQFLEGLLTIHLLQHEGTEEELRESAIDDLDRHLHWSPAQARRVVTWAQQRGLIHRRGSHLELTPEGRHLAQRLLGTEAGRRPDFSLVPRESRS